jgi:serine/threonine protein kinase
MGKSSKANLNCIFEKHAIEVEGSRSHSDAASTGVRLRKVIQLSKGTFEDNLRRDLLNFGYSVEIEFDRSHIVRPKHVQFIDLDRLSNLRKFNAPGGFGKVISVEMDLVEPVMLKSSGDTMDISEFITLSSFSHPNIVQVFGSTKIDDIEYFVMRRCPKSLKEELDNQSLSRRRVISHSLDLFRALVHIHNNQKSIVHSDIKPSNLLITDEESPALCICDFGISGSVGSELRGGTAGYMAPECYEDDAKLTTAMDIYACGITMAEMTHKSPNKIFQGAGKKKMKEMTCRGVDLNMKSSQMPKSFIDLAYDCISMNPDNRPTAVEAYKRLQEIKKAEADAEKVESQALPNTNSSSSQSRLIGASVSLSNQGKTAAANSSRFPFWGSAVNNEGDDQNTKVKKPKH